MAIIYSYPLTTSPLNGSDLMLISDMTSSERPTRSVTLQQIANFASAGGVAGVGQVIAGNNITLDPPEGTGIVTLNAVVPAPVTYTFSNASVNQTGDAVLRVTDGTTDQDVVVKAGNNITIDANASDEFTINADIPCWTLSAENEEGNISLLLSDGGSEDPEGCPDTAVTFAAGENMTITANEGGSIITFTAAGGGSGGMTSWTLSADAGTNQTITNADTVTLSGGNVISTNAVATDEVTIGHDAVSRTNTATSATLAFGSSFAAVTGITSSTEGHITNVTTSTLTVPSIPCASSTIGGIRASAVDTTLPAVSESGDYFRVEIIENEEASENNCFAVVKVPTGGSGYVLPCAEATTLGGIKAPQVNVDLPAVPETGTYYPVEVLYEQEIQDNDCRAVVKIPDFPSETNQGFSPLDIYNGQGFLTGPFTIATQTVGDLTLDGLDRVDVFVKTANGSATVQCHVWAGTLLDPAGAVFKGSGSLTGLVSGINTITLSSFNVEAGKPLVIYFTMNAPEDIFNSLLTGPGTSDGALCQASGTYTTDVSNNLVTATTPLSGGGEIASQRVACHFYKI